MFSLKLLGNKFLAASLFSVILIIAFGTDNSNGKTNNILSICSGESRGSGIGFVSFQRSLWRKNKSVGIAPCFLTSPLWGEVV